jgi:phosphoglucomutase
MKFYLFASDRVGDPQALPAVKARVRGELDRLKRLIEADARARAEG